VFSKTAEYALRAVVTIARAEDGRPVLAKEIADKGKVPPKYLSKVLRDLVRAGILSSSRGIGGGFKLKKKSGALKLIEVVRPFDEVVTMRHCPFGKSRCSDENPCPLHYQWKPVVGGIEKFLEQTTVDQLTEKME
jgi:Rrf2 family protein